jgi:hypothetical protein
MASGRSRASHIERPRSVPISVSRRQQPEYGRSKHTHEQTAFSVLVSQLRRDVLQLVCWVVSNEEAS